MRAGHSGDMRGDRPREVTSLVNVAVGGLPGVYLISGSLAVTGLVAAGVVVALASQFADADAAGLGSVAGDGPDVFASLTDAESQRAFLHTARSVIDPGGQRVDIG